MQFAEILYNYTADNLKKLARLCGSDPYTRKDELVRSIHRTMLKPDSLRQVWVKLDDLSKKAIAAAYHNDGEFNQAAFVAQYGSAPAANGSAFRRTTRSAPRGQCCRQAPSPSQ